MYKNARNPKIIVSQQITQHIIQPLQLTQGTQVRKRQTNGVEYKDQNRLKFYEN